jgi:hypothetical protein
LYDATVMRPELLVGKPEKYDIVKIEDAVAGRGIRTGRCMCPVREITRGIRRSTQKKSAWRTILAIS